MDVSTWIASSIVLLVQIGTIGSVIVTQGNLDDIAKNLDIRIDVIENLNDGSQHKFRVTFNNKASTSLSGTNWTIYFYSFFIVESTHILSKDGLYTKPEGYILEEVKLRIVHENGCLFSMSPVTEFEELKPNTKREITFFAANWAVSKTDIPPNWYITVTDLEPRVLQSTAQNFVGDFTDSKQWKRMKADRYNPYSPTTRYQRYETTSQKVEQKIVIPTPKDVSNFDKMVTLDLTGNVTIVPNGLNKEAEFLADKTSFKISNSESSVNVNIHLSINATVSSNEGYFLKIDQSQDAIYIAGKTKVGVFYGIQTLLSMLANGYQVPQIEIRDEPRFEFRGMHVDVARNFIQKKTIYKLLDAMAMYKLNKLHLHLTDDEGWRIEINGLPELTQVGSKRCQSDDDDVCLIPQLGSGPDTTTSGSGYYSQQDYKDILTYAKARHIEVIPEIDMPGHARAAIMAMETRYRKLNASNMMTKASQYRLIDPDNDSKYLSVQSFRDNAMNPCIDSTYSFIDKVVSEIKQLHDSAGHPLTIFHFGGDEVANTAWINSTACNDLNLTVSTGKVKTELKKLFTERVANITVKYGLDIQGWEDGFTEADGKPFDRTIYRNQRVLSNAWDNVWEWGEARRAYNFANDGYQNLSMCKLGLLLTNFTSDFIWFVGESTEFAQLQYQPRTFKSSCAVSSAALRIVMSHATHVYFDHPYEPDPDERGLYWATRFTDSFKTFGFLPDNLYENIDVTRMGVHLSRADACGVNDVKCPPLTKPENIIGMQGHLWSETVLSEDNFYYMVFPRLLALAERAWHNASWENENSKTVRDKQMKEDWDNYAYTLGHKELHRLDKLGIKYRVPPPGARKDGNDIITNAAFPGLDVEYSTDNQNSWKSGSITDPGDYVYLRAKSANGTRYSRVVKFSTITSAADRKQATITTLLLGLFIQIMCMFSGGSYL